MLWDDYVYIEIKRKHQVYIKIKICSPMPSLGREGLNYLMPISSFISDTRIMNFCINIHYLTCGNNCW